MPGGEEWSSLGRRRAQCAARARDFRVVAATRRAGHRRRDRAGAPIPKSTAYELVRTLTDAGYLERSGRAAVYFLGRKLFELGMAYRSQIDLLKEGSQIVEELRDETGETVQLSVLENEMMLVLIKEEGSIRSASSAASARACRSTGRRPGGCWFRISDDEALTGCLQRIARQSPTGKAPTESTSWSSRSGASADRALSSSTRPTNMPAASRRR